MRILQHFINMRDETLIERPFHVTPPGTGLRPGKNYWRGCGIAFPGRLIECSVMQLKPFMLPCATMRSQPRVNADYGIVGIVAVKRLQIFPDARSAQRSPVGGCEQFRFGIQPHHVRVLVKLTSHVDQRRYHNNYADDVSEICEILKSHCLPCR